MIVYPKDIALAYAQPLDDKPWIGWRTILTETNVAASSAASAFPVTNLVSPSTAEKWRAADETEQTITVTPASPDPIDYVAIARHNFGTRHVAIYLEGRRVGTDPYTLISEIVPGNDKPILFKFDAQSFSDFRLRIAAGAPAAELAVLYAGALMRSPSGIQPAFSPLAFSKATNIVNGVSEGGDYLGEITTRSTRETSFSMTNLPRDWCRDELLPFLDRSPRNAFFFAWRPLTYPEDIGYAWQTGDTVPEMYHADGRMQVSMNVRAIA